MKLFARSNSICSDSHHLETFLHAFCQMFPSWQFLVQNQQSEHQNNMLNLFKVNSKGTRTTLNQWSWLTLSIFHTLFFWCSIVDFEQVNAGWVIIEVTLSFIWFKLPYVKLGKIYIGKSFTYFVSQVCTCRMP